MAVIILQMSAPQQKSFNAEPGSSTRESSCNIIFIVLPQGFYTFNNVYVMLIEI